MEMRKIKKVIKICLDGVDDRFRLRYFTGPAESGTPLLRGSFYVHLGLQIGTQFCPGMISDRKLSSAQD